MKRLLVLVPLVAACGLTDPGRPDEGPRRAWNLVAGPDPGSWHGAKLTWDPVRHGIVMYTGRNVNAPTDSTKVYLWKNRTWTEICTKGTPPTAPRYLPGFVWNPKTQDLVLAGGSYDGPAFTNLATNVYTCNESDEWTLAGSLKEGRAGADLVFNPDRNEMMLIGGRAVAAQLHTIETSTDAAVWQTSSIQLPFDCAGAGQNVTWDSNSHRILALAGELSANRDDAQVFHDEVWSLYSTETSWDQVCKNCSGTPRTDASIVHLGLDNDDTDENYVINGYIGHDQQIAGTWILDHNDLLDVIRNEPAKRDGVGVAYDADAQSLITHGGTGQSCPDFECSETLELESLGP
ncbi:MAG TPA: hypothetical protein VLB44_18085 [Kofleriaceae bacterium]|nr:hypothetical protein [Kofleriaceae bacterium]